uniref:(northern house mosquito) hypothetical protein n=1 Tax=Culex pipiens TaxID=7175 RepID=A0A8D8ND72_CULPI
MHETDQGRSAAGLSRTRRLTWPSSFETFEGSDRYTCSVELRISCEVWSPWRHVATELARPSELSVSRVIESESVYSPEASQSVVGPEPGRRGAVAATSRGCFSSHSSIRLILWLLITFSCLLLLLPVALLPLELLWLLLLALLLLLLLLMMLPR